MQALSVLDTVQSFLPDTVYSSAKNLIYQIDIFDQTVSGSLTEMYDMYVGSNSVLNFRGSLSNETLFYGEIAERPTTVSVEWIFKTDYVAAKTLFGIWGGGTG